MTRIVQHPARLSRIERYAFLCEMTRGELRCGDISRRRHRHLLIYATRLGFSPSDAAEIIDEIRQDLGLPPAEGVTRESVLTGTTTDGFSRTWLILSALVLAASVANLLLLNGL